MSLAGARLGLYRVGHELGRGGMGTVYRARSEDAGPAGPAGSVVALKIFHEHLLQESNAFERFRREAEIGKRIRHPHVVRTFDVGEARWEDRPVHYMVMELIEGQTLADLLKELGTVPEHLRYAIADQALGALQAIHEQGIVHRDVKPQNIVITPDHRVLLMDLGVARLQQRGHTLTESGEFVGSLIYAAPEQFGRDDEGIGARADLYAFGVVLHELTTGRCPFEIEDLPGLLRQKLHVELGPLRSVRSDVGAFWNEVVVAATRNRASERFTSAAEMRRVLQEGEAGTWWQGRTAKQSRPVADRALQRLRLEREVPLIGRAEAWERLGKGWEIARQGGGVLLVGGASGVGKSRLLYDFLEQVASADGPSVAAGRGVGAGGRSYQPFVEALLDLLAPDAADPAERRSAIAARLGPLLADTPGVVLQVVDFLLGGLQPGVEGALSKDALLAAASRILQRLAKERPLILVVEDLHLAGAESIELFRYVARGVEGHPFFLVGVYSEDEIEEGTPLHALVTTKGQAEVLSIAPLDAAATEELVRAVVRTETTTRALAHPLHERSDGNALLVLELLAHLKAGGVLVPGGDGLELARSLDLSAVPSTVRDLTGLKLNALDEGLKETIEAAAVLGYEFDAPLLASVLGQNRLHVFKRLAELERKHRLLVSSGKSSFRFAGRQMYEGVYAAIPAPLRSEYHALVADTISAGLGAEGARQPGGPTAYALLRHLLQAGRATEAAPFLETALDHVAARFHASFAAPFLERVATAFADAAPAKRLAIAMKLWTCYEFLASRADQMRVVDVAHGLAERMGEPGPRARVHAYRAGSYWYAGDYERATAEAGLGLERAREAGDRKWEATCRHTLGAVAYRRGALQPALEELREALRIRREIGDRRGEASTLQALGLVMSETGQEAEVLATMQEALKIWREVGERRGEASVLMNIGNTLVESGEIQEGVRYLGQAIAGHRETGALLNEALALANLGNAEEILGRIDAARTAWQRALRLCLDLGDPNGELAVRTMLGAALGAYGEHAEARMHLDTSIELAGRKGAKSKLVAAHREMGKLLHGLGQRAQAWAHLEMALALESEVKSVSSRVLTLSAMGQAALTEGDAARAVRLLTEALPAARSGGHGTAALVLCRLARAHAAAGRSEEAQTSAREALARLETAGRVSPALGPEIYATLAEFLGDEAKRQEFLARARAIAEERARNIRDATHREHFLTQSWPNARFSTLSGGARSRARAAGGGRERPGPPSAGRSSRFLRRRCRPSSGRAS